jgi:hypothetical protein
MKTYLKYVIVDTDEYQYTRGIHDDLDRIALRCEEELAISPAQLNDLHERLENRFECVKNARKLLWHGPLKKQSPRRRGDIVLRYVILFSDCVLVCNEESGRRLDIKRELSMKGLTLDNIENGRTSLSSSDPGSNISHNYYSFRVNAVEKSYEFLIEKEIDRDKWVEKIQQASDDFHRRYAATDSKLTSHR